MTQSGDTPHQRPSPRAPRRSPRPRLDAATDTDPAAARAYPRSPGTAPAAAATTDPRTNRAAPAPWHAPTAPTLPDTTDTQAPPDQLIFHPRLLGAYDQHGCHLRHQESPPDATTKLAGGLSRVYERAKPPKSTTINGTSIPARDSNSAALNSQCAAGYPSTTQLAALNSLLALLALKLYGQRRRSHVYDIVHDRALGLFCGLNVLPKRTHLTSYSYRAPHVNTTSRCWKRSSPASVRSG